MTDRGYLTADLSELENLLATMPDDDNLGRIGLESRRNELRKRIAESEAEAEEPPKQDEDLVLRMLGIAGYELYRAHLVGNNCNSNQKRLNRMQEPRPGDLVLETSSTPSWILRRQSKDGWISPENAIGFFVRKGREAIPGIEWDEEEDGPLPTEVVWYIEAFDGRLLRWTNANFVTIVPSGGWGIGV